MFYRVWGDTNFIGVVNSDKYKSFVDKDWDLQMLVEHFVKEMNKGNLLIFQMTEEGIEHEWNIEVTINTEVNEEEYFRRVEGYIIVTNNRLYLTEYTCLTMAAQFEDEEVPDKNCSDYLINIENGIYRVDVIQFYNADKDEYTGNSEKDILLNFTNVSRFKQSIDDVIWCSY